MHGAQDGGPWTTYSDLAVWPNSVRRLERIISVGGTQPVRLRTSTLVTWSL